MPLKRLRRIRRRISNNHEHWKVRQKDIRQAITTSNNSSPGPDGIPFGAWRATKEIGENILLDVIECMESDTAEEDFLEAYKDEAKQGEHLFNTSTLVCLPKDPSGEDPSMGKYYLAKATRPLSIVNSDNRLIASAMRIRWETQLAQYVKERQQGFLRKRSILKNLVEVDTAMMMTALKGDRGAALFLDFEAAFPSIDQEYVHETLKWIGLPDETLNSFRFLYKQCKCNISVKGETFDGFGMGAGVRQGCPLSPLVYVLIAETLLDMLEEAVDDIMVRAYADDTALVVQDYVSAIPRLEQLFAEFEQFSGLKINVAKSVLVPLNDKGIQANKEVIAVLGGPWSEMKMSYVAKYLGFMMGPGKAESSWEKPCNKFKERLYMWKDTPTNIHWQTKIYNVFALSTLSYIWQLEEPPSTVLNATCRGIFQMARGPGNYASIEDMWSLKEAYGLPVSFQNAAWCARAAQMRVLHTDTGFPSPRITRQENYELEKLWVESVLNGGSFLKDWFGRCFLKRLCDNEANMEEEYGTLKEVRAKRKSENAEPSEDDNWPAVLQRTYYEIQLGKALPDAVARIRYKLKRLELDDDRQNGEGVGSAWQRTPAGMADRSHKNLMALSGIATPRVQAAVWGWIWNKWATDRRTKQNRSSRCILCGREGTEDSGEHYCVCPLVAAVMRKRNLDPAKFMGRRAWGLASVTIRTEDELNTLGTVIYATNIISCRYRHNGRTNQTDDEEVIQALLQSTKEAVKGHNKSISIQQHRWMAEHAEADLIYQTGSNKRVMRLARLAHSTEAQRKRLRK